MRFSSAVLTLSFAALLALSAQQAHAQDRDLSVLYELVPRAAAAAEFEEALAEHAGWRAEEGDPWTWDLFQVVTGDRLGTFFARAPQRSWADLDAYDADFGPRGGAHFNATVGPHLRSNTNVITRVRPDVSHLREGMEDFQLLSVTMYRVKPGKTMERKAPPP